MDKLECVGESPKHPSNEVMGQHAIEGPDDLKVESFDVRPRKGSTVPFKQTVKELEKLDLASADGTFSKEKTESTSLPSSSEFKPKSAGGSLSPTEPNASKASPGKTREYSGSSIPDSLSDVACQMTSPFKQAENDTVFSQSHLQVYGEGTGAQACSQDEAGSLQSLGSLHVASLDQSKHPKSEPEEEEDVSLDEELRAPIELFSDFLKAVMDKDYPFAKQLCELILIYEPENQEAQQFMLLIEMWLTAVQDEEDESSDDTEDSADISDSRSSGNADRWSSSADEEDRKKTHEDCPPHPGSE